MDESRYLNHVTLTEKPRVIRVHLGPDDNVSMTVPAPHPTFPRYDLVVRQDHLLYIVCGRPSPNPVTPKVPPQWGQAVVLAELTVLSEKDGGGIVVTDRRRPLWNHDWTAPIARPIVVHSSHLIPVSAEMAEDMAATSQFFRGYWAASRRRFEEMFRLDAIGPHHRPDWRDAGPEHGPGRSEFRQVERFRDAVREAGGRPGRVLWRARQISS